MLMNVTDILRFIGTICITNSHFGLLYPAKLEAFATGALVGNSLFFFASGYALYFSRRDHAAQWYTRRLLRLYLPLWIFLLISIFISPAVITARDFIFPTFWFVQAILVFYVLFYPILRYSANRLREWIIGVMLLFGAVYLLQDKSLFIVEDVHNPYRIIWFYYFAVMLFGAYRARKPAPERPWIKNLIFLLLAIGVYYGCKGAVKCGYLPMLLQFILPLTTFFIADSGFGLSLSIARRIREQSLFGRIVKQISSVTYEIYIIQFLIIYYCAKLDFPAGLLAAMAIIPLSGLAIGKTAKWLNKQIYGLIWTRRSIPEK